MSPSAQRRGVAYRRPIRRKPLWLEQLEDRVVPTVIELTSAGATGAFNGALFYQSSSGTGIDTIVRLASNQTIEQGFNSNFRPVQFDENTNSQYTHAVQLSSVPTVISAGGLAYYEFLLNINQLSSSPLLSVDELRFYVTNSSTVDPTLLHNYSVTAHTLQDDSGKLYSPVYDLNPATPAGNYIKLDYSLATGNGTGDMVALLPVTSLGTDPNQYVYLYSKLGVHFANNDGFDEWSTADTLPVGSISGVTFVDTNGNGLRDAGEPGVAGVNVFLDANNNGVLDPGEVSTVTAADGSFSFSRLLAGTYHVREVLPAGWIETANINSNVSLASGQNATGVALGNFKLGTISGTKFEDVTGNGFSADDPVLNSANPDFVPVTMQLLKGSSVVATTTTGNDGNYTFTGIGPGTYTVAEVKPNGWIQTATSNGAITATSGFAASDNFDNYRVAFLLNNVLAVRTTQTGSGTLTLVQDASNLIDITLSGQSAGSFPVASFSTIQITSYAGFTVNTNQVGTVPVVDNIQPGNNSLVGGASGTTVMLNSGSTDTVSVTGGQNILSFLPTTFGVTFNAGMNQGQLQPLDTSGQHFVGVTGVFQTVVGTNFSDTLTAALPSFNSGTGAIGPGTTIFSGLGQDTIYGTLGTKAQTDGSASNYTQVLSSTAINELEAAISMFGGSPSNLGGFGSSVTVNGGFSNVNTNLLTNITLNGTQNTVTQAFDASGAQALQSVLASFGNSTGNAGGFGGSITASGGFNLINTSALTNVNLSGGTNAVVQSIDANAEQVLDNIISSFGNSATNIGGFGSSVSNLGGFGGSVQVSGGFNQVQTTLLANVNLSAGTNTYIQTIDTNAAQVLTSAIQTIQQHFGGSIGNSGGFGGTVNALGGFGNTVGASGGFNTFVTSILTNVQVNGGNTTYVQSLDQNSAQVLETAIASFGSSVGNSGGFGGSLNNSGGFGNSLTASGGFNQIQTSLMTSVNVGGGNNTYIQSLDANSAQVLESAISSFGASTGNNGGFGGSVNNLGGFGNSVSSGGGFNKIRTSILTNITANGSDNLYLEALDDNSRQVLDAAISAFGGSVSASGGFGNSLTNGGGFGNTLTTGGGYNQVETSLLTAVSFGGGNNVYFQLLDNNSAQVLEMAITSFGNSTGNSGGFGGSVNNLGGFGNTVNITGGFNQLDTSILTTVTITGGNNFYLQTLDTNSTLVLDQAISGFGNSLGNGGGFGNSVTNGGGFGNSINVTTGGFNNIQVSLLTSVTVGGGDNLYAQSLDANSIQVLTTALGTIASFGGSPSQIGGFGNNGDVAGGYNTAQVGLLTTVHLHGGSDTLIERLTAGEISVATTALANAAAQSQASVNQTAQSIGLTGVLADGDDVIVGGLLGTFSAGIGNDRFVIEDPSLLGAAGAGAMLLQYGGKFTSGSGNNTYYFVGQSLGHVAVNQAYSPGTDTLDFSRFQGGGITLNLGQTGEQTLAPGLLYLTLSDGMGISNVVGTGFSDTITANGRNGTIMGLALLDPRASNAPAPHAPTQVVFLDFDTYTTDPTTQHVYTSQERQAILAILQTDYALFPFVQFTLTAPTSGAFETIFFNRSTGTTEGGAGGNSSEIDFRNLDLSAFAEINVNGFIGSGPGEVPATDPVTGQDNWVTLSATIAAHELGHTMGEQHEFSYGPVGFSINNPPGNAAYRPSYPGPDAAWETHMHIMASPASVGSTLLDAAGHPFFGEREAIALAYINDGTVVDNTQNPVANNSMTQAQPLTLVGLQVPNPATNGFEAGMQYSVAATDVVDSIGLDSTGHSQDKWYSFAGKQGDLMNFDIMSYHLTRITDPVDTVMTIYDSQGNVVAYYNSKAQNDDNFETADAHIIDLTLPADGTYYVKVDSFTDPTIQPGQPGYSVAEATDTEKGHYELLIYRSTVGNPINPSSHDTVVLGSGQSTVYGVDPSNPMVNPQAVTYNGVEGTALSLAVATFGDPGTPVTANFSATIDWGDGRPASAGTVSISGNTVTILGSHAYAEEGTYTTTLTLNEASALSVILKGKAMVADAQLTNAAVSGFTPKEGLVFSGTAATFTDPGGSEVITDYTATINWGDNSLVTAGTIVSNGNGQFSVTGSHTYKDEGNFQVNVTITHDKLAPVMGSATIKVSDAALSAASSNLIVSQGLSLNAQVASFTDANPVGLLSDFTANITWGDGSSSAGVVSQPGGMGTAFVVSAGHAYGIAGTLTVTVTIADVGGQSASTSFTVTVQPSIIVLNPTVSGALTLTGKVAINIAGAVVVDSNSATALSASGTSQITAGSIQVVGGVSASNGAILSPAPITGIKSIADPLASLAAPVGSGSNLGTINLAKGSLTINPGIYTQISVSGTGTTLTLNPGVYIITGGGFSVGNSANVNGVGVMIYNTGSNFPNTGGTFGAISFGSSGKINLSAPTTGSYAGILIFQSRDNTRALSLNASSAVGVNGTVYAPTALLSLGGSASLKNPVIVNQLTLNGNGGSALTADGTDNVTAGTAGQLLGGDLFLYVSDPNALFNADELARLADTITGLDNLLAPYNVTITDVTDATAANLILDTSVISVTGGLTDGVLGCFVSDGVTGEITLIQGWNWYTGTDPTLIGANEYDFQTILTHEMGHALGLGHNTNPDSVMHAELVAGVAHRNMTVQDLNIPDSDAGPDGLHAAPPHLEVSDVSFVLSHGVNRSGENEAPPSPAIVLSTNVHGPGFSLADFSSADLGSTEYRSPGFDATAYEVQGSSFWSDTAMTVGFGEDLLLKAINFEETTNLPISSGKVPEEPQQWKLQLSPRSEVQPEKDKASHEANRPSVKSQAGALGQTFSLGSLEAESPRFDRSGNFGPTDLWDLDERLGWLLLGMFMVPPREARSENEARALDRRSRRP